VLFPIKAGMMSKLLTLQAARGVAANLVVLSHLFVVEQKYTHGAVLPSFAYYGVAGVDLFFVLSGFIMVAVAGRGVGPWEFLWRRAARIYPTYWLVTLVVLAVVISAPEMVNSSITEPISIWRSFLLLPARTPPLLAVGWTLVHEIYFYLVFAIFLSLRIPVFFGLIAWGVVLLTVTTIMPNETTASPVLSLMTNPLTAEFMMGAIVGLLWMRHRTARAEIVGVIGVAALAFSIAYSAPALSLSTNAHLNTWRVLIFGVPSALVLYAMVAAERRTEPLVSQTWLVAIGDWSYATYLVHVLVISAIGRALRIFIPAGGIGASLVLVTVGIVTANVAGALVHILFERPTLNWLHQLGSPLGLRKVGDERTIRQSTS
jgi:peptidoglycan/LPS O-acetylase OafA/YrhL